MVFVCSCRGDCAQCTSEKNKRGDAKVTSPHQPINKQGTIQCADSNRGLATTTVARVHLYTTPGKNSCCHTPETVPYSGSLDRSQHDVVFIIAPQRVIATYILQPVDWLVRPASGGSFSRQFHRPYTAVVFYQTRALVYIRFYNRWDPGTSASPKICYECRRTHYNMPHSLISACGRAPPDRISTYNRSRAGNMLHRYEIISNIGPEPLPCIPSVFI